ncbi:MAG: peptidylprolyl isomerase [Chloroflexi bacterium]|nr:peptidylprolyl isomerase [Chloroflexota bacterium]
MLYVVIAAVLFGLVAMLAVGWYLNQYRVPRKVVAEIDGVQYQLRDVLPYALLDGSVTGSFAPDQGLNNLLGDGIIERKGDEIGAVIDPGEVNAVIVERFEPASEDEAAGTPPSLSEEGRDSFERFLDLFGVTEDDYRAWTAGQLRREAALEYFTAEAPETTEQIHVEWIVTTNVTDARNAVARLEEGEEFAEVAGELNEDSFFADAEGVVGWVPEGVLLADVDSVLFAESVEQDEVQGPHTTGLGTIVFRVTDGPSDEPLIDPMRELWAQNDFQEWIDAQAFGMLYYFTTDDARWLVDQLEDR